MMSRRMTPDERRFWGVGGVMALIAHGVIGTLALTEIRPAVLPDTEPVVLVELPPPAIPSAPVVPVQPRIVEARQSKIAPRIEVPPAQSPLPEDPVILPAPLPALALEPVPQIAAEISPPPVSLDPVMPATPSDLQGDDPKVQRQEANYFALVSAHLNRRKTYPTEARKARQEGVVTVRFTTDRTGAVSNVSIRRSSGHDVLDAATLQLLQRVAPLPRMPASMKRDSVILSLPIEYSLRTN